MPHTYKPQPISVLRPGRKPDGFSFDMEVLCTVPLASSEPVETIAADFRCPRRMIAEALSRLAPIGVTFIKRESNGELQAFIPKRCRGFVAAATEEYWNRVHEGVTIDLN